MKSEEKQIKQFEIVLAILMIAFISAVLFPRAGDLFDKSKRAVLTTSLVSFSSAINLIHQKWLLTKTSRLAFMNDENKNLVVVVNEFGWPLAVLDEKNDELGSTLQCEGLWQTLLEEKHDKLPTQHKNTFFKISSTESSCFYQYSELTDSNTIVYEARTGKVFLK